MKDYIPYGRQNINQDDINEVVKVLKSDFLTQGPTVSLLEENICKKIRAKYAIASNSATSALHLACLALDLNDNDIVWTSPISFVASANCALYCGAKVDFVDIDPKTGLISIHKLSEKLKKAENTNTLPSILIPVHLAGASCDMNEIKKLSDKYGFKIIEDASHALGGKYENNYIGGCQYSDITVFSLHPVKIITSGEGGLATTNCDLIAEKISKLRSHGIEKDKKKFFNPTDKCWIYEQQLLGYNYRMSDIHAALGLSQLRRLDHFVIKRNEKFNIYKKILNDFDYISFLDIKENVYSSMHLAVIVLGDLLIYSHKNIFNYLRDSGIGVQLHYIPIHCQPYYLKLGFKKGDFPNAEKYSSSSFSIPLFPTLKKSQQEYVCKKIKEAINNYL